MTEKLNKNIIFLILKNFEKKDFLDKKIFPIKNSIFRELYYSLLVCFVGEWSEVYILKGDGQIESYEGIYNGHWEMQKGKGIITKKNYKTLFEGLWYGLTPLTGKGTFFNLDCIYDGEWLETEFKGTISSLCGKYKYEGREFKKQPIEGVGQIFDNKLYSGVWRLNECNGKIISKENGEEFEFEGIWDNVGIKHGNGTIIEDENKYIGEWSTFESEVTGSGKIIAKTGDIWTGIWDRYFWPIEGEGVYISNKVTYSGIWKAEVGNGIVYSGNNSVFKGTWNKYGQFIDGCGSYTDFDNNTFDGVWKDCIGKGSILFPNGKKTFLEWDSFRKIINGDNIEYYDADNRKYVGNIENGEGTGVIYSNESFIYKGTWDINGYPINGDGIFIASGLIYKGKWKNSTGKGCICS